MDRRGIRRMRRGAGGPPRQAALAPVGRGGARAGRGGRGGARAGNGGGGRGGRGGRGGGRAGHGGGGRGGRGRGGGAGGRGQLQAQMRARPPVPPHMDDWLKRAKFGNPNGLNFEQLERELDGCLTNHPRIDQQEMDTYPVPRHQLNQGQGIVPLLMEASDNCRKMSFTRKMLLRMYLNGNYTSAGAQFWRKSLDQQEVQLDGTYYELRRVNARHRPMPDIFLTRPSLLPKDM